MVLWEECTPLWISPWFCTDEIFLLSISTDRPCHSHFCVKVKRERWCKHGWISSIYRDLKYICMSFPHYQSLSNLWCNIWTCILWRFWTQHSTYMPNEIPFYFSFRQDIKITPEIMSSLSRSHCSLYSFPNHAMHMLSLMHFITVVCKPFCGATLHR